jgi:hypothetical protein
MALIKPIDQLTREDLEQFPLWEFAMGDEGEHDETAVRPVASEVVPDDEDTVFQVACDVTTASGRRLLGHVSVCNGAIDDVAPTLVTDGHGSFGLEERPHRRNLGAYEALLGGEYESHFPIEWQLRLPLAGEAQLRMGVLSAPPSPFGLAPGHA